MAYNTRKVKIHKELFYAVVMNNLKRIFAPTSCTNKDWLADETTLFMPKNKRNSYGKNGQGQYVHRAVTNAEPGDYVFHINGNLSDNKNSNLLVIRKNQLILSVFPDLLGKDETSFDTNGYAVTEDGKIFMHRLIVDAKPGDFVIHLNGNLLDNRNENLLLITTNDIMKKL